MANSKSPVVFFVFKRPATTKRFLDIIASSGTKKIYIFSDAGRNTKEKKEVSKVRDIIKKYNDSHSELEIIIHNSEHNLGLKINIISGLNYVFKHEDDAIIIEDDCLPHPDFFKFCNAMLSKYRNNNKVMSISGTSIGANINTSYLFTKYSQCWGWASWARAWEKYDVNMKALSDPSWNTIAKHLWSSPVMRWYWMNMLKLVKVGQINTWDFQWSLAHFINDGLAIAPTVNLIENIGFDGQATNTTIKSSVANLKTGKLSWPLKHPLKVSENKQITKDLEQSFYGNPIAILGMMRQYIYYLIKKYAHWN